MNPFNIPELRSMILKLKHNQAVFDYIQKLNKTLVYLKVEMEKCRLKITNKTERSMNNNGMFSEVLTLSDDLRELETTMIIHQARVSYIQGELKLIK